MTCLSPGMVRREGRRPERDPGGGPPTYRRVPTAPGHAAVLWGARSDAASDVCWGFTSLGGATHHSLTEGHVVAYRGRWLGCAL